MKFHDPPGTVDTGRAAWVRTVGEHGLARLRSTKWAGEGAQLCGAIAPAPSPSKVPTGLPGGRLITALCFLLSPLSSLRLL